MYILDSNLRKIGKPDIQSDRTALLASSHTGAAQRCRHTLTHSVTVHYPRGMSFPSGHFAKLLVFLES